MSRNRDEGSKDGKTSLLSPLSSKAVVAFLVSGIMAYVGSGTAFADAATDPSDDFSSGTTEQCASNGRNCLEPGWSWMGITKTVVCCCPGSLNHYYLCNKTIEVYQRIGEPAVHCYRQTGGAYTSKPCQPVYIDEPTNTKDTSRSSCCSLAGA